MHHVYKTDEGVMQLSPLEGRVFQDLDVEVHSSPSLDEDSLIRNCADADALIVVREPITRRVMESLSTVKVVARCGVGVDTVDVEAASDLGVQVCNVPDGNFREVAAHALGLILLHNRRLGEFDADMRAGRWRTMKLGHSIRRESALTLGVLGFGRIGRTLASMASAVGFTVQAHDPYLADDDIAVTGAHPVGFDDVISEPDVISLHLPLKPETRHVIDAETLRRFRPDSLLVNVARGGLVDELALVQALHEERLGGAALDVFESEPLASDHPLRSAPRLTMSPHAAYLSADSLEEVGAKAFGDVARVLRGDPPAYPVNNPAVRRSVA